MDPYLKAAPDLQCGATKSVAGDLVQCMRFRGHDGMHATEPSPGETMTWPNTLEATMTGILGPYGLKRDTPEEIRQQRTEEILERQREDRRDAVELAVSALTPLAGAYRSTEEYGEQIVNLALHLGAYIRNGV